MELSEACNHMTCAACNHSFCFICLLPWRRFHDEEGCPVYGDLASGYDEEGYEVAERGLHLYTGRNREGQLREVNEETEYLVDEDEDEDDEMNGDFWSYLDQLQITLQVDGRRIVSEEEYNILRDMRDGAHLNVGRRNFMLTLRAEYRAEHGIDDDAADEEDEAYAREMTAVIRDVEALNAQLRRQYDENQRELDNPTLNEDYPETEDDDDGGGDDYVGDVEAMLADLRRQYEEDQQEDQRELDDLTPDEDELRQERAEHMEHQMEAAEEAEAAARQVQDEPEPQANVPNEAATNFPNTEEQEE